MQTFLVFSVRDTASGLFRAPMFMVSRGEALRQFSDVVSDPQMGVFYAHPSDFELFELGTWCDLDGQFKAHQSPVSLGRGSDFRATAKQDVERTDAAAMDGQLRPQ